jgi:hypothetical protein
MIAENLAPQGFDPRTVQPVATGIQDYNAAIYVRNKVRITLFQRNVEEEDD